MILTRTTCDALEDFHAECPPGNCSYDVDSIFLTLHKVSPTRENIPLLFHIDIFSGSS